MVLVHEWLTTIAGSEMVLQQLVRAFPDAPVFCVLDRLSPADRSRLGLGVTRGTWLNRLPFVQHYYRGLLPLMPGAMHALDLSSFDLVISSSHAVAKGVHTRAGAVHVCYCHSPMRYAWDLETTYLDEAGLGRGISGRITRALLARLRNWDRKSAERVTQFIANSAFVAERIGRVYQRTSTVVHPPVNTSFFHVNERTPRGAHYVTASRLVGYKRVHRIVEAFRHLPDRQLVVVGDGPDRKRVLAAAGPNVTWLGRVNNEQLRHALQSARAFVFAAEEDFGILPVEAQACGTPVIALGRGGALETVRAHTGTFFAEATAEHIAQAIQTFEAGVAPTAADCRANAERFGDEQFHHALARVVQETWASRETGVSPERRPPPAAASPRDPR